MKKIVSELQNEALVFGINPMRKPKSAESKKVRVDKKREWVYVLRRIKFGSKTKFKVSI